jgi:ATP-dependent Lon protease
MSENNKSVIISKLSMMEQLKGTTEYNKLSIWINEFTKIPFGKYILPPITKNDNKEKIKNYLQNVRNNLNQIVYGLENTKEQIIKVLAQTITNSNESGNIFALQGPPGVGKTTLIQNGISKALNRPFAFICLGGSTDASFLEGHEYTFEGSKQGKIIEVLQQTECMNPVIYFDELDKVSETARGEEIINILTHITDTTQNTHFNDKYFGGIDIDLSKAVFVFSFNDEQKISKVLRDRIKIINIEGYNVNDKINIAKNFLIPKLKTQIGLNIDVIFNDDVLKFIINTYTNEYGIRKFKEIISDIFLDLNLRILENNIIFNNKIIFNKDMLKNDYLKNKQILI